MILDFGRNEFEGIGTKYHFDEVKMELKDSDGEPIPLKDFQEVNKENTPRKQNNKRKSSGVVEKNKKARLEEDRMDISDDDFEEDGCGPDFLNKNKKEKVASVSTTRSLQMRMMI